MALIYLGITGTSPYGYVIDLAVLGQVRGGLLSIRKTSNGAATNNPSGWQEVLVLKNASVLYGNLTIHSELPVYIAGNFNSYASRPAMIQAPLVTMLPADWERQVQKKDMWQVDRSVDDAVVPGGWKDRIPRSSENSLPTEPNPGRVLLRHDRRDASSLGRLVGSRVARLGAVEGVPWKATDPSRYAASHLPAPSIPTTVAPVQPKYRILEFDENLRDFRLSAPWILESRKPASEQQPEQPTHGGETEECRWGADGTPDGASSDSFTARFGHLSDQVLLLIRPIRYSRIRQS